LPDTTIRPVDAHKNKQPNTIIMSKHTDVNTSFGDYTDVISDLREIQSALQRCMREF